MADHDSSMDWQADVSAMESANRPRAPPLMILSNALPIRTEFGQVRLPRPSTPNEDGSMRVLVINTHFNRPYPMVQMPQQAAARRDFMQNIKQPSSEDDLIASRVDGTWSSEALGVLAAEMSSHPDGSKTEHQQPATSAAKRAAEDSWDHRPAEHALGATKRVKAVARRTRDAGSKVPAPLDVAPSDVPPLSLEDSYERFWSDEKPHVTMIDAAPVDLHGPYQDLIHEDSIRLLCLEPGKTAPLSCRLVTQRLSKLEHRYEALSYAWGDPNLRVGLRTPDGMLAVTNNLHAFLCHLRFEDRPRYIWVDAACIDQSNLAERNHQVGLMKKIYMQASSVVVWLGRDASNKARLAFSVVCSIASGGTLKGQQVGQAYFYSNGISSANIPDLPCRGDPPKESFTVLWKHVQELFDQAWFWRIWCIQEVTLAKSAKVHWGTCSIPWETLGLAAARLRSGQLRVMRRYPMPGVYNAYFMYRLSTSQTSHGHGGYDPLRLSFLRLLALTGQFGITDARDRVFGLLGMPISDNAQDSDELYIKPDYRLSTQQVYEALAEKAIAKDKLNGDSANLALMLASVQHVPSDMHSSTWYQRPSWIPHWGEHRMPLLLAWESEALLSASPAVTIIQEPRLTLSISGVVFDSIAGVAQIASNPLATDDLQPFFTQKGKAVLAMTLTGGKQWHGSPADLSQHLLDFDAYYRKRSGANTVEDQEADHRFEQAVHNAIQCRILFSTMESRQLGLGADVCRPGDTVVLLEGASTPFVLRQATDVADKDGGQTYRLIGECYVYDIINTAQSAAKVLERLSII